MTQQPQTTTLCPACGSGKIAGSDPAHCVECGWEGDDVHLLRAEMPLVGKMLDLNPDRAFLIAEQISKSLYVAVAKIASRHIGLAILSSGLCGKRDNHNLARLIKAGCGAAHQGILEEADAIAKEYSQKRVLS